MGGGGNKKCWTTSSSASVKVLLFMVSLIVVTGFVSVLGPFSSNWYPWLWSSGLPASSSSSSSVKFPVSSVKESENRLDLVVVEVHNMEEAIADDSVVNRSSTTPPHAIEPLQPQPNGTKEDMDYTPMSGSSNNIVPPMNESDHVPLLKARRDYTNLDRIEAGLRRARAAIKEAKQGNQTQD